MPWLNLTMPNQTVKNSLKAKKIKLPQMNFVLKKQLTTFMYFLVPFILQIFYKKSLKIDSELWWCAPFVGPKQPICPEQKLFGINHCYYFHLPMTLFIVQNLRKVLTMDPELWQYTIFGPKVVHLPRIFFFRKPVNEPCFFYSCLSTCQKSKSDINLLVKYWWFKNTEISLAESHFCF